MLLDSFRVVGFGPFRKRWSVSVGELRGLIAVVGPNGAGKSTFLELALPGALFRTTPTRGSLVDLAVARDACLDVTVVNGSRWTLRHLVDSVSKKSEALVLKDGEPATADAKVRTFDEFAARHFPAAEVLLSTTFGAQGTGGFLAAKPAERKSLLLKVLGVEKLERLAEQARERLKGVKAQLDTTAARLADERARGGDVSLAEANLEAGRRHLTDIEGKALAAQKQLDSATEELQRIQLIEAENATVVRSREALDGRIDQARLKVSDIDDRLRNCHAVIAEAEAIRQAVATLEGLQAELAQASTAVTAAEAEAQAALAPWLDVNERMRAVQFRADRAGAKLKDRAAVEQAALDLPDLRDATGHAEAEVATVAAQLEELQNTRLAGAGERIAGLRSSLETIHAMADTDTAQDDIADVAREGLVDDDNAVTATQQTPVRIAELKERLTGARDRLAVAQRQQADAERLAARSADVAGAEAEQAEAEAELRRLAEGYAAAGIDAKAKRDAATELQLRARRVQTSIDVAKPLADKASGLAKAEGLVAEREAQKANASAELAALVEERKAFEVLAAVPPKPDTDALRREFKGWQDAAIEGNRAIAALEQRLEQVRASAARQAELEQQEQAQLVQIADLSRVAADLGKDGLQALEIDAAGPELTAITNELLHGCHGPRFTARVETQRSSADGKRMLEGCDVQVLDTVQGREAAGETFSGGERVILAEALALAITVLACRRSGLTDVSLVRDESGAALDPSNARVYVAMLRKAVEMIGARHCLLVSHVPEVQDLCDHRIEVGA